MMKAHGAIARALADNQVRTLFGLIGDGNLFMVDSFIRQCGGEYVSAAHEAGAVLMALGYAQVAAQGIGVATVTHGPGLSNTLTALAEGVKGRIPLVLLSGDTAMEARDHFQKIPQRELVVATGAGFEQLRSAQTIGIDVATSFRRAQVERRPIVLNMPADIQWQDVAYERSAHKKFDKRAAVLQGSDIDDGAGIIATAKRPLILAGRGAANPESRAALLRLARRIDAPLATTLKGKDLFRSEENNLGIFGTLSSQVAFEIIGDSDCIIAFGASLNHYTTANESLVKGKRLVHVSQELEDLGRFVTPDAGILGEPSQIADLIIKLLDEAEIESSKFFDANMRERIAAAQSATRVDLGSRKIQMGSALRYLNTCVPSDRIFITDGGRFVNEAWCSFDVESPLLFPMSVNFGSIGLGLAEAIGASFAAKGRPTLLVTGDGGFMNGGITEFHTAVREKVDLIVVVCNDGSYGAEYVQFKNRDMAPAISCFQWPSFADVATSLGGAGITVRTEGDLALADSAIRERKAPLLIDLKLDPETL